MICVYKAILSLQVADVLAAFLVRHKMATPTANFQRFDSFLAFICHTCRTSRIVRDSPGF